jgi:hypothetical protein
MSQKMKFRTSLRISHPTKTAGELIEKLKITPWISRSAEQHRGSTPAPTHRTANTSTFLTCPLDVKAYACFEDFWAAVLASESLEDEAYLQEIVQSGGTLELSIGLFCHRSDRIFFDQATMREIGRKQIDLLFDIHVEST